MSMVILLVLWRLPRVLDSRQMFFGYFLLHDSGFASLREAKTRSGVIGICVIRTPTASLMALAMAAATGTTGGSPTPLAPNGPSADGTSTSNGVIVGTSWLCGSA